VIRPVRTEVHLQRLLVSYEAEKVDDSVRATEERVYNSAEPRGRVGSADGQKDIAFRGINEN